MKKSLVLLLGVLISSCVSAPSKVAFNDKVVGTYSVAAGCGTLSLDQDCSQISGSTREIKINEIRLRVAGGDEGKNIFVMSMPKFSPDQEALKKGSKAIENFLRGKDIKIISTKVMYGSGKVFGVHYILDRNGYSHLKLLSVK